MSILDGLPRSGERSDMVNEYDVRWALINPTDEQVEAIGRRCGFAPYAVRAVLAAAVGGDQ